MHRLSGTALANRPFCVCSKAKVRNPVGFDKFAGSEFARAQRARRGRRMDAPNNPSLSANKISHIVDQHGFFIYLAT